MGISLDMVDEEILFCVCGILDLDLNDMKKLLLFSH